MLKGIFFPKTTQNLTRYRQDRETDAVKTIEKRKREYIKRFNQVKQSAGAAEVLMRKRAREEYPSDDETSTPQRQRLNSSQSKRAKHSKRKLIEEEIIAPKLSDNSHFLL